MKKKICSCMTAVLVLMLVFCMPVLAATKTSAGKTTVRLNKKSVVLYTNKNPKKITLKATVKGTSKKVKWTSSNKSVATVSKKGKVTAKKAGTAVIKATVNGKTAKCKVRVKTVKKAKKTTTSSASAKKVLSYLRQKRFKAAEKMVKKLPQKANEASVKRSMNATVKAAYRNKIKDYGNFDSYYLTDINKDGTPELLIKYGTCEADYRTDVWTYQDRMVYCGYFFSGHSACCAYPDGNGMMLNYGHMGYERYTFITMNGTSLETEEICDRDVGNGNYIGFPYYLDWHIRYKGITRTVDYSPLK